MILQVVLFSSHSAHSKVSLWIVKPHFLLDRFYSTIFTVPFLGHSAFIPTYASPSGVPIEIISKVILRHANLSKT